MSGGRTTRQFLVRAFKATGCRACGARYPDVEWDELHAHHRDPKLKLRRTTRNVVDSTPGVWTNTNSNEELLAELLKCEVLCAECHRREHRNGGGTVDGKQLALFTGSGSWRYS